MVILDVVFRYLSLFCFLKDIKIFKIDVVRLAVWAMAVHLAVAGNGFNGVSLCCPFFPMRCLRCDLGLN